MAQDRRKGDPAQPQGGEVTPRARPPAAPGRGAVQHRGVDPPHLGIGDVGVPGGELVAADREHPVHDVGVAALVRRDDLGVLGRVQPVDRVQDEQRVPQSSRHQQPAQPHHLVRYRVQPRGPARPLPGAEVERRRAGVQGLDRDHEPHPVDRGDVAAAPVGGDADPGLRVDQAGGGGGDALAVEVALLHPQQPALGQRRDPRLDHGHQADVAGAGHQQRSQRDVEVIAAQVRAGDVPHPVEHAGPGVGLQQQLGVVDARQQRGHRIVDRAEPLRRRGGLQPGYVQPAVPDGHFRVVRQPRRDLRVGVIDKLRELPKVLPRVGVQAQRGQHGRALAGPYPLVDQPGPRVAPLVGADRVHVAAPQRQVQRLQHAEHVGGPVDQRCLQPRAVEHQPPPRPRHQVLEPPDVLRGRLAGRHQPGQRPQRGDDLGSCLGAAPRDHRRELLDERPHRAVPAGQLRPPLQVPVVLARRGLRQQLEDRFQRGGQLLAGHHLLDPAHQPGRAACPARPSTRRPASLPRPAAGAGSAASPCSPPGPPATAAPCPSAGRTAAARHRRRRPPGAAPSPAASRPAGRPSAARSGTPWTSSRTGPARPA